MNFISINSGPLQDTLQANWYRSDELLEVSSSDNVIAEVHGVAQQRIPAVMADLLGKVGKVVPVEVNP